MPVERTSIHSAFQFATDSIIPMWRTNGNVIPMHENDHKTTKKENNPRRHHTIDRNVSWPRPMKKPEYLFCQTKLRKNGTKNPPRFFGSFRSHRRVALLDQLDVVEIFAACSWTIFSAEDSAEPRAVGTRDSFLYHKKEKIIQQESVPKEHSVCFYRATHKTEQPCRHLC